MVFNNSHHFRIDTFNAHNHSTTTVIHPVTSIDPLAILHAARAVEATHTSKTASYAPKCKPGTRAKVIQDLVDDTRVVNRTARAGPRPMLWFRGPAGGGKTCIMREVARHLTGSSAGMLAATYFFSNRIPGLSEERPFVATIAHQFLSTIPQLRPAILKAVEVNVSVFDESLETQMDQLIVKPLASIPRKDPERKYVILVDGFDECVVAERGHLLEVLHTLATSTPSLLIIIASRPELDIRTAFNSSKYKAVTNVIRLEDYDGSSDIRNYLCDEFCRIRETHPARASIPASWPVEEVLDTLVEKSSGNYILPSTVIKYVGNPRRSPLAALQNVTGLFKSPPAASSTLAELDAVYTMILHPPDGDIALIKRILHCIIGVKPSGIARSSTFFDKLLGLQPGTTEMALCDFHSLLTFEPGGIRFQHATLKDFLTSEVRSADLYQSPEDTNRDFACLCARVLEKWSEDPSTTCEADAYAASRWMEHLGLMLQYQEKENPSPLPQSLLQFDAQLLWKYQFIWVFQFGSHEYITLSPAHGTVNRNVLRLKELYGENFFFTTPLGRALNRMKGREKRVEAYCRDNGGRHMDEEWTTTAITLRLTIFEIESGLSLHSSSIPSPCAVQTEPSSNSYDSSVYSADPYVFMTRLDMHANT